MGVACSTIRAIVVGDAGSIRLVIDRLRVTDLANSVEHSRVTVIEATSPLLRNKLYGLANPGIRRCNRRSDQ